MPFDKLLREMIREELRAVIAPIADAVAQLQEQGSLATQLSSLLGTGVKRGPGRPRKLSLAGLGKRGNDRGCAISGCRRPARSKGYCAAHYQKYRMLTRTRRLPADWAEHAPSGSVKDVVLQWGRAGAKALAESRQR